MLTPNSDDTQDRHAVPRAATNSGKSNRTGALLEELHAHSVLLRDLYKSARWQTADIQFRNLRLLFDDHYKEQIRLVDVLTDRIRLLAGPDRVFAGVFLRETQFSCALRGRASPVRLLDDLYDAHEFVLSTARAGERNEARDSSPSNHDFAVGQVVIANELQSRSIGEQLMRRGNGRALFGT
jgi:DNA-binding ferritin-like protein